MLFSNDARSMMDADRNRIIQRSTSWVAKQSGPFTYATALRAGLTRNTICVLIERSQLVQLRRGVLCDGVLARQADGTWLRAAAALVVMAPDAVVSHQTAADLYDLPVPAASRDHVWLTRPPTSGHGRHRQPGIIERAASLPARHCATLLGLPVTTAARTVVDLARHLSPIDAVVAADAALHKEHTTAAELEKVRLACASWPGITAAEKVLTFADGAAASPLESRSRIVFAEHGLPRPELQTRIELPRGRYALADFCWLLWRVIGEADGRLKYTTPGDLWREKVREDQLREAGFEVVRWTWDEIVNQPEVVVARILQAAARRRPLA